MIFNSYCWCCQIPKIRNKIQKLKTTRFLYFQKTEIRIKPKIKPTHIIHKGGNKKELIKIPKINDKQKQKNILEALITLTYKFGISV